MVVAAADASIGQIYNLGGGEVVSLRALAELLVDLNGGGRYRLVPFPDEQKAIDIGDYYGTYAKLEAALGWQPRVALRDGLARTLEYYRQHHAQYWP